MQCRVTKPVSLNVRVLCDADLQKGNKCKRLHVSDSTSFCLYVSLAGLLRARTNTLNTVIKNISRNIFRFDLLFPNVADFKENNILQRQFSSLSDRS